MQQSQITAYNELIHAEGISDVEVFGYQLADWIIKNNIVEQIFGPNLHVEVNQFSQLLVNMQFITPVGRKHAETECKSTNESNKHHVTCEQC